MKMNKKMMERFDTASKQIYGELKTDRHILACLGSVGLIFNDDLLNFIEFLIKDREGKNDGIN